MVCVGLESRRLAGADHALLTDTIVYSATASDVTDVVVAGRHVVRGGSHAEVDTSGALEESIRAVLT
jgi:cytosine/adenosine deaminase-related metal-dependent hydrolase